MRETESVELTVVQCRIAILYKQRPKFDFALDRIDVGMIDLVDDKTVAIYGARSQDQDGRDDPPRA